MICPNCGCGDSRVDKTIQKEVSIIRFRKCKDCGERFRTMETYPKHLKKEINKALSEFYGFDL